MFLQYIAASFLIITNIIAQNLAHPVFPVSTEFQIGKLKPMLSKAPKGICLSVGGERAFREASMFDNIEHLMIVDYSERILTFCRINTLLLNANSRMKYRRLRWESNYSEWQELSSSLTEDDFKWWNKNIRENTTYAENLNRFGSTHSFIELRDKIMLMYPKVAARFNNDPKEFLANVVWDDIKDFSLNNDDSISKQEVESFEKERNLPDSCFLKFIYNPAQAVDWGQLVEYRLGNYLFDDHLYQKLHMLSIQKKIHVVQGDLSNQNDINAIKTKITSLKSSLSILDLNNLYLVDYLGEANCKKLIDSLSDLGTKESIVIFMSNYGLPCIQLNIYVGFTFENVRSWPKTPFFSLFINNINHELLPVIDGRLYEKNDRLPLYLIQYSFSSPPKDLEYKKQK